MMADRRTLEDDLRAGKRGAAAVEAAAGLHPCPNCDRLCRAFEIVDVTDVPGLDVDMACTRCLTDEVRADTDIRERKARKALTGWAGAEGVELKAYRNRYLDTWRWTVARDSPLTETCQLAWVAHLQAWHRMTLTAATPSAWTPPPEPALDYAPLPKGKT